MTNLFWLDELKAYRRKVYQSKRWLQTRLYVLSNSPFCKCGKPTNEVDHIIPLSVILKDKLSPEMAYNLSNLQALCKKCHSKKSYTEGLGKGRKKKIKPKGVVIVNGKVKKQ